MFVCVVVWRRGELPAAFLLSKYAGMLRKSEVLREGFLKGLRDARKIILRQLSESVESDFEESLRSLSVEGVEKSIQNGANIEIPFGDSSQFDTPICWASAARDGLEIVKCLIRHGVDLSSTNINGESPLHLSIYNASKNGNLDILKELLKAGADVNQLDHYHASPLHIAVLFDNIEAARILLENGADVNIEDYMGDTPLDCAKSREMKELLLITP